MPRPTKETFQNSNIPKPVKLPKGTLVKIDFGTQKAEIDRIWEGKPSADLVKKWTDSGLKGNHPEKYYVAPSMSSRYNKIKQLVGYNSSKVGYCSRCRSLNEYLLKQKVAGAVIVTRFCSEHVPDKI